MKPSLVNLGVGYIIAVLKRDWGFVVPALNGGKKNWKKSQKGLFPGQTLLSPVLY